MQISLHTQNSLYFHNLFIRFINYLFLFMAVSVSLILFPSSSRFPSLILENLAYIVLKDSPHLYSIRIATSYSFSYELLIVSYKIRLYHYPNTQDTHYFHSLECTSLRNSRQAFIYINIQNLARQVSILIFNLAFPV